MGEAVQAQRGHGESVVLSHLATRDTVRTCVNDGALAQEDPPKEGSMEACRPKIVHPLNVSLLVWVSARRTPADIEVVPTASLDTRERKKVVRKISER